MRVIVTGATGFVGQALVPHLLPDHEVFCLIRGSDRQVSQDVTPVQGDLADPDGLSGLPVQADVIVHLAQGAGRYPEDARSLFEVNAGATSRLIAYARRAGATRFVFTSTGSVYESSPMPLLEGSPLTARPEFYVLTKRVAEGLVSSAAEEMSVVIHRLFAPYGPGQRGRLIARIVEAVRTGGPVAVRANDAPHLNPIWIDDLVAVLKLAVSGVGQGVINVAGPRAVGIREIATIAAAVLGVEPRFVDDPVPVGDLVADTTLMQEVYKSRALIDPEEGIARLMLAGALRA